MNREDFVESLVKVFFVLKECNFARNYNLKHKGKYKKYVGALRRFKRCLESQQDVLRKQSNGSSSALWKNYRVDHLLAKKSNPMGN